MVDKDSTNHQARTLVALTDISRHISSSLDYQQIALYCLQSLTDNLDLVNCSLFVFNKDLNRLVLSVGGGSHAEIKREYGLTDSAPGKVFRSGMPLAVHDIADLGKLDFPQLPSEISGLVGFLGVPLIVNQRPIGVLIAFRVSNRTMIDEDINVMKIVASILSQTMKLSEFVEGQKSVLKRENEELSAELEAKFSVSNLMSSSASMQNTLDIVRRVCNADATVLLRGESGTGKTMIAKGIHYSSKRKNKALVTVNCAAIPENLIESELFGHEKGSFTGAISRRIGKFESAEGGTIFLDEIGELSLETQAKLLRIIQDGQFERIGSNVTIQTNVRIVCATNANLERMIKDKSFREDLYYRLMVIPIFVPPLRDRKEDVLPLLNHFIKVYNDKYQKVVKLTREAVEFLEKYNWPGNVRELENTIERSVILAAGDLLTSKDIPLLNTMNPMDQELLRDVGTGLESDFDPYEKQNGRAPYERIPLRESQVRSALEETVGIQTIAAKRLGVSLRQLRYAIRKYEIDTKTFKF